MSKLTLTLVRCDGPGQELIPVPPGRTYQDVVYDLTTGQNWLRRRDGSTYCPECWRPKVPTTRTTQCPYLGELAGTDTGQQGGMVARCTEVEGHTGWHRYDRTAALAWSRL